MCAESSALIWLPLKSSFWSSLSLLQPTWLTNRGLLPIPLFPDRSGRLDTHAGRGLQWRRRSQRRHQRRASLPGGTMLLHFAHVCKYCEAAVAQWRISGWHTHTHAHSLGSPDMGVDCQLYLPQRLSNEFVLSTHPVRSQMCSRLLRLALEKIAGSLEKTSRPFLRKRQWAPAQQCLPPPGEHTPVSSNIACLSEQPCLCHPPPHTAVCPRGFCHARSWPCTRSRPGWDVSDTVQRVGVYLRCLWQVAGKDWPRPSRGSGVKLRCGSGCGCSSGVKKSKLSASRVFFCLFFFLDWNFLQTSTKKQFLWLELGWVVWKNFLDFCFLDLGFGLDL